MNQLTTRQQNLFHMSNYRLTMKQVYRLGPWAVRQLVVKPSVGRAPRASMATGPIQHIVMVICYNRRNLSGLLLLSMMAQICANAHEAWMHFV